MKVSDFRPIHNARLFYKIYAYMCLHRIEHVLEGRQLEEQHGSRPGRRMDTSVGRKPVVAQCLFSEHANLANHLALSKTFGKLH